MDDVPVIQDILDDADYEAFLAQLNAKFIMQTKDGTEPLFTTNADSLWDTYLESFANPVVRQYHNCHACRHFIQRFGGLVTIDDQGHHWPAMWHDDEPSDLYRPAISAMARLVRRAKVTGVFLSDLNVWGQPVTGVWHHLFVTPKITFADRLKTAGQAMAEKHEDFLNVMRALQEFPIEALQQALRLLNTESLYRSEKVLGPAVWLHDLHVARNSAPGSLKANIVWRAVASAPAGFCHPRASMIGTLLEDIVVGMEFAEVSRRFAAKMHPLQYQRPHAAPAAGTIEQAEKVVEQLGIARSLQRRFARLDEIETVWRPKALSPVAPTGGIFAHLEPKPPKSRIQEMTVPAQVITWDKFAKTVLPTADAITWYVNDRDHYTAILTSVHADAPIIFQWGHPFSWYVWNGGSLASQWGLQHRTWVPVTALTMTPCHWTREHSQFGKGLVVLLADARESRLSGSALFPECLLSDLHGVRSVIEAYSQQGTIDGMAEASACGVMLNANSPWQARVKVTSGGSTLEYKLDRWD